MATHAIGLLLVIHAERVRQGAGGLLDVQGIHDQRLGELPGSAGEPAEDQHAPFVVTRGDELLRHQVHSVVQAPHVTEIRRAQEPVDLRRIVMGLEKADRTGAAAKAGVDPIRRRPQRGSESAIGRQARSARFGNLHEDKASDVFGMPFEQPLDRHQFLDDAFGVVETIDADAEPDVRRQSQLPSGSSARHASTDGDWAATRLGQSTDTGWARTLMSRPRYVMRPRRWSMLRVDR